MKIVLKRASRLPFAPIVAGLFSLASAILVMATPVWLLEELVGRFGLAEMISAAAPPLGIKARILMAAGSALAVGLALLALVAPIGHLLGRKKPATKVQMPRMEERDEVDVKAKTVAAESKARRRPIFAGKDLGAPFMSETVDDEPVFDQHPVPEEANDELVLDASYTDASEADTVQEVDRPLILKAPDVDPVPPVFVPAPVETPFAAVETAVPAPQVGGFAVPLAADEEETTGVEEASGMDFSAFAPVPPTIPVLPPVAEAPIQSISELVDRLEQGMDRRAASIAAAQAAAHSAMANQAVQMAAPQVAVDLPPQPVVQPVGREAQPLASAQKEVDSALRQALNTLERLAAGGR